MSDLEYEPEIEDSEAAVSKSVKPKSVVLNVKESEEEKELRLKRERLLEIKEKLAKPGGDFGIGIFNTGRSYNKFTTKDYDELRNIQKKENKFRKILGQKPNKKPITNVESGFKPEIDPRILNHGLKQRSAYYGGGSLNMVTVEGTNAVIERRIQEAEKIKGGELDEDELKQFEPSESILEK